MRTGLDICHNAVPAPDKGRRPSFGHRLRLAAAALSLRNAASAGRPRRGNATSVPVTRSSLRP